MSVEDAGVLGAHRLVHLALDLEDLVPGLGERLFQPLDLLGQVRLGNFMAGNGLTGFSEHDNFPPTDTSGDRDATQNSLP